MDRNRGVNSKIEPLMTFEDYIAISHEVPYVYNVATGTSKLSYFGTNHAYHPEDPIHPLLLKALSKASPDLIVVECFSELSIHKSERERESFVSSFIDVSEEEAIERAGEAGTAIKYAARNGVDVVCPEPTLAEEAVALSRMGFSKHAMLLHYVYRTLPHWISIGKQPCWDDYSKRDTERLVSTGIWKAEDCSLDNIELLSKKMWGSGIPFEDTEELNHRFWPSYFGNGKTEQTEVNEAARYSVYFRDRYIVNALIELLSDSRSIFVAYGCQHAVSQEATLKLFGTSTSSSAA